MERAEGEILESGTFQLYRRGNMAGWMFMILSPEGDTHRLIRLAPQAKRQGMTGTVVAVAGRPANLLIGLGAAATALAAAPVAAGDYRLARRILFGEANTELGLSILDDDEIALEAVRLLDAGRGCHVGVCSPRPGSLAALPADLRARFEGHAVIATDPPHYLDYVGIRLLLTPEQRPWEPLQATALTLPQPLGTAR